MNSNSGVNLIGYGYWGSLLARKLIANNLTIDSLATSRSSINVPFLNRIDYNNIEDINWDLPTFISSGPLHHHSLISRSHRKVFVEKPLLLFGQSTESLIYCPYVNYIWCDSARSRLLLDSLPSNMDLMKITLTSANFRDRSFSPFEDFLPHIVSLSKLLNFSITPETIQSIGKHLYYLEGIGNHGTTFLVTFGYASNSCAYFQTSDWYFEVLDPLSCSINGQKVFLKHDPISESIARYLHYYYTEECLSDYVDGKLALECQYLTGYFMNHIV